MITGHELVLARELEGNLRLRARTRLDRVLTVELIDQGLAVSEVISGFPFRDRITDPLDLVLETTIAKTGIDDLFNFKFILPIILDRWRRWSKTIRDVIGNIRFQEGHVKDWMNATHVFRQIKTIGARVDSGGDSERT